MGRLDNKVAIITGAASGIGLRDARFASRARVPRVVVADLNESEGPRSPDEIGGTFVTVNVADEDSVKAMYETVDRRLRRHRHSL